MHVALQILIFLFCALTTPPAFAEVTRCGNVWTTGPCNQAVTKRIRQIDKGQKNLPDAELSQKKKLLHDLNRHRIEAQKEYDFVLDVSYVQRFCLEEPSSLKDCQVEVDRFERRLKKRIAFEVNRLKARSLRDQESTTPINSTKIYNIQVRRRSHTGGQRRLRTTSVRGKTDSRAVIKEKHSSDLVESREEKAGYSTQLLTK